MQALPWHPALVHLPLGLAFLLPVITLVFFILYKKKAVGRAAWMFVLAAQLILPASAYIAMEAGEDQEEVVEEIVGHDVIHEHEELAETFFTTSLFMALVVFSAFFITKEKLFVSVVIVVFLLQLAMIAQADQLGKSGGIIVYEHLLSEDLNGGEASSSQDEQMHDDDEEYDEGAMSE